MESLSKSEYANNDRVSLSQLEEQQPDDEDTKDRNNSDEEVQLQAAASIILEKNLERNKAVDLNVQLWIEFEDTVHSNGSSDYLDGEGYWALSGDFGPSIVTHIMLEYYKNQDGWWQELLHEVVHGERPGTPVFFKPDLFARWKMWFEHGEWKDVPKGRTSVEQQHYRIMHPVEAAEQ